MGYRPIWTFAVGRVVAVCEEDDEPRLETLVHDPDEIEAIETGRLAMTNLRATILWNELEIGRATIQNRVRSTLDSDEYVYCIIGDDAYGEVVAAHIGAYRAFRNEAVKLAIEVARRSLEEAGVLESRRSSPCGGPEPFTPLPEAQQTGT